MNVTNIYTAQSNGAGSMVGYGSITLDEIVTINFNIIKNGQDGHLFLGWPQRDGKDKEGNRKFYPHMFYTDKGQDFKKEIEEAVLADFATKMTGGTKTVATSKTYAQKADEREETPAPKPEKKKLWNKPT